VPQATVDALLTRAGSIEPTSANRDARTVRVTWSTGADVQREDFRGRYVERLSMDPAHVRLDRLSGASVLDNHDRYSGVRGVLGVVRSAGVTDGIGTAELQFSARADVQPVFDDVCAGIVRNVSVGYSVAAWRETTDANGMRVRTAIDWTPREISFVPLAADAGAHVRSENVDPENTTITDAPGDNANRAEINGQIRTVARVAGLPASFADGLIDRAATVEQARAAAFTEMQRRAGGAVITSQRIDVGQSNDDPAVMIPRMAEALACRIMPGAKPSDQARPFMGLSMIDMARATLEARGTRTGLMAREDIVTTALRTRDAAHTVSDFNELLTGTGNRVLRAAYEAAPNPLKSLARQTTLQDFRPRTLLSLSEMPKLQRVTEQGEIKSVSRSEGKESYGLETFGQIFSLSRKAILSDDLNSFSDWSTAMGRAAAETEAGELVELLTRNAGVGPTMNDTKALFHTDHGNLAGTPAAIDVTPLSAGRLAMRKQTGLDNATPINATARFLLVPPDLETAAEKVLAQLYAATVDDVNPFSGKLTLLTEARLADDAAWYLFADPGVLPVLEYAYLASAQGPQMRSREGWDVLGVEFRCITDFGCGAIDWRGCYRNAGASE
jgi:hypothetical protein